MSNVLIHYKKRDLEWAVGKLYVEKDFKGESKKVTEEMIQDLFSAFRNEILNDATWMSEKTKDQALVKTCIKVCRSNVFMEEILKKKLWNSEYNFLNLG